MIYPVQQRPEQKINHAKYIFSSFSWLVPKYAIDIQQLAVHMIVAFSLVYIDNKLGC